MAKCGESMKAVESLIGPQRYARLEAAFKSKFKKL